MKNSYIYRKLWGINNGIKEDLKQWGDNLQFITPITVLIYGAFAGELKLLQIFILYYCLCAVTQVLLKWLFNNPRPREIDSDENPVLNFDWSVRKGNSFPSGHTMSAFSGGIFWFNIHSIMGWIGIILGITTAVSRLVVKAHWIRDVVTSAIIAVILWIIVDSMYLQQQGIHNLLSIFF